MNDELAYHEAAHQQWQADQEHFYGNLSLSELMPTLPHNEPRCEPPLEEQPPHDFTIRAPEEEPNY